MELRFWLDLVLMIEPSSLDGEQRKLLVWLNFACLSKKFDQKGLVDSTESLSITIKNGRGLTESGHGRKNFCANNVLEPSFTKS